MKLIFNPAYSGNVFQNFDDKKNGLCFNTKVCGVPGLLSVLCLFAGMRDTLSDSSERLTSYYHLLKAYINSHPDCVLKQSFEVDGLNTSAQCLSWRDALRLAGWNEKCSAPSHRMEVLTAIEQDFSKQDTDNYDLITRYIAELENNCPLPENLEIVTIAPVDSFLPVLRDLLKALQQRGVKLSNLPVADFPKNSNLSVVSSLLSATEKGSVVKRKLDVNDKSFKILHFETRQQSYIYLSKLQSKSYQLFINTDTKLMDNWMRMLGKPTIGSSVTDGLTSVLQLLQLGLAIFAKPLNIKFLIDWLNVEISPFSPAFRGKLSSVVASNDGYYNKECKDVIDDYISGKFEHHNPSLSDEEFNKQIEKDKQTRINKVADFLPNIEEEQLVEINVSGKNTILVEKVKNYVSKLSAWASIKSNVKGPGEQNEIDAVRLVNQLYALVRQCETLKEILNDYTESEISFDVLEGWVSMLVNGLTDNIYQPQIGAFNVIDAPAKMADVSNSTIWFDFYESGSPCITYNFLTAVERKGFSALNLWNEEDEHRFNLAQMLLPFHNTRNQLTLVVVDRIGANEVKVHPLYIRLTKQIENFSDFIETPDLTELQTPVAEIEKVENLIDNESQFVNIQNGGKINWTKKLSYSSLDLLINYPFDYVMQSIAYIQPEGYASMPETFTAYGTVAHAVIENLFGVINGVADSGTPNYISKNIDDNFDKVFTEQMNAYGAVLLNQENLLDTPLFKKNLKNSVWALHQIIEENNLRVLRCEWNLSNDLGFGYDTKVNGFVDMTLENAEGKTVIFDFKWSGGWRKYSHLIEENRSIQLALYTQLLQKERAKDVVASGYFLMPSSKLYTASNLKGTNVVHLNSSGSVDDLVEKLRNAYEYRRQQITSGQIEISKGLTGDKLDYVTDTQSKKLYPLELDDKKQKIENKYTIYNSFK